MKVRVLYSSKSFQRHAGVVLVDDDGNHVEDYNRGDDAASALPGTVSDKQLEVLENLCSYLYSAVLIIDEDGTIKAELLRS